MEEILEYIMGHAFIVTVPRSFLTMFRSLHDKSFDLFLLCSLLYCLHNSYFDLKFDFIGALINGSLNPINTSGIS